MYIYVEPMHSKLILLGRVNTIVLSVVVKLIELPLNAKSESGVTRATFRGRW